MKIVEGGGIRVMTNDPVVIAAVRRCAELESQVRAMRLDEVARYRTLRRDVRQIRDAVIKESRS